MSRSKQLYVAWVRYQRRPATMSEDFGYDLRFLPALPFRSGFAKAVLSYPLQAARTVGLLIRERPSVLWIQTPPNVLVHLAWLARLASRRRLRIVADLHNAALSPMWFGIPGTRRLLGTFDTLLVHNETVFADAVRLGIDSRRMLVLEDRIPVLSEVSPSPDLRPVFVVPCSFREDEPVDVVLEAARRMPEYDFRITGSRDRAEDRGHLDHVPANVGFTDFIATADYEALVAGATGVLCLTTEDGIQLSAATEAVGAGKPMIISDTPLLRTLFATGLFVDNTAEALVGACRAVVADYPRYAADTRSLRADVDRARRWATQAAAVRAGLALDPRPTPEVP